MVAATAVIGLVGASLEVVAEFMKTRPDYDQKKKEEFFKRHIMLKAEWSKPYGNGPECRDDDLIMNLKDELVPYVEAFYKEIKT